jgi:hypothetical protein
MINYAWGELGYDDKWDEAWALVEPSRDPLKATTPVSNMRHDGGRDFETVNPFGASSGDVHNRVLCAETSMI